MSIDVHLRTIPHESQRYETAGDWHIKVGEITYIYVSDMQNRDYEWLAMIHEIVEAVLCQKRGISDEEVTLFDEAYEAKRPEGDESEPGDDLKAPYHREHRFATKIEKLMAKELDVDWMTYDTTIVSL